jgi:hypothetical protein
MQLVSKKIIAINYPVKKIYSADLAKYNFYIVAGGLSKF